MGQVLYHCHSFYRYYALLDGYNNLIAFERPKSIGAAGGQLYLTPEGYVSELSYKWWYEGSGNTYISSTNSMENWNFKYDNKGYLQEIKLYFKQEYERDTHREDDNNNFIYTHYESITEEYTTTTLTWDNGNLTNIERNKNYIINGQESNRIKQIYHIKYDTATNPSFQYPYSIAMSVMNYDQLNPMLLLGLFGRGPANMPVSIEEIDNKGNSTINEVSFILRDLNGLQVIDTEKYQGTYYHYLFSIKK